MHPKNSLTGPDLSRRLSSPRQGPSAAAKPTPTDLVGITTGAKSDPDLSESQVRLWVTRGRLPSYRHPDPNAGRRPGRGRSIQKWISMSELAAFAASMKKKGAGSKPAAEVQP